MKKELTRDMYILLSKFAKENNIKMEDKEFISALKSVFMNMLSSSKRIKCSDGDYPEILN